MEANAGVRFWPVVARCCYLVPLATRKAALIRALDPYQTSFGSM